MKRVTFYTLGCKLNFSETSTISRMFEDRGYQKVGFTDSPDIFVINTCSVTHNADKKCSKVVRDAKAISPDSYIVVMGCYAQLKPNEIARIPGVDAVVGAAEKFKLLDYLEGFEKSACTHVFAGEIEHASVFNRACSLNDRTRAFLKVQDGCNYGCAFCTIPLARGKSRSDNVQDLVKTAGEIAKTGIKEIVLTGVNIGDFGIVEGRRAERFINLIRELDGVEGIERFRISSLEPNLLTDEIIDFVFMSDKFVPHFHIPLQSGSDEMLRLMDRRYRTDLYKYKVEAIKGLMPQACIGADVIVGFPGETEKAFMQTCDFLGELDIAYLHVFTYSERPNTKAIGMKGKVTQEERSRRSKLLRNLSEKKKRKFYEEQVGSSQSVLFENDVQNGKIHGFTENYVRVTTDFEHQLINTIKPVVLHSINGTGLMEVAVTELTLAH